MAVRGEIQDTIVVSFSRWIRPMAAMCVAGGLLDVIVQDGGYDAYGMMSLGMTAIVSSFVAAIRNGPPPSNDAIVIDLRRAEFESAEKAEVEAS